ncbi:MAG: phosphate acyltransferase PlsX [Candidatus Cloacimonetes bacterium]|nr:phosphate acyltransferase PlsX [Candidatus Cloacimonadota bacterium]
MRIALDAHGSDNSPAPEVEGAVKAIYENYCDFVYLVGKEEVINKELSKYFYDKNRIKVVDARQVITMEDSAALSSKNKPDSSLVRAMELHKNGEVEAVVSAGNTGAVMASSLFLLGRVKNVHRPAIALPLPTQQNYEIVLDVGANVDCEAEHLVHFAILGSLYAREMLNIESPRVSLLNIGEESVKGSKLIKTTYALLAAEKKINFIGNIEGKDLLKGVTDVVVCDGFVGNIILKTVEGAIVSIFDIMKEQFKKDWVAKIGALLSFPVYSYLKKKLDHTEYGGALLVGLNGLPIVAHGRSNGKAIMNALKFACKISNSGFVHKVQQYFEEV